MHTLYQTGTKKVPSSDWKQATNAITPPNLTLTFMPLKLPKGTFVSNVKHVFFSLSSLFQNEGFQNSPPFCVSHVCVCVSEALEQTESSGGEFIFLSSSLSFLNADGGALTTLVKCSCVFEKEQRKALHQCCEA